MADLRTLISTAKAAQIAKLILLLSVGIAAAVFAVPFAAGILSSAAPPYLFLTVHLIIVIIWKLSDKKQLPEKEVDKPPEVPAEESRDACPDSVESCITEDSGDRSPASVVSAPVEMDEECESDSMDDTWRAIVLRKGDTWERARPPEAEEATVDVVGGGRKIKKSETLEEPAPADDEWNQRFEAFIRKNYDQIRLQTDSYERRVEEVDDASS